MITVDQAEDSIRRLVKRKGKDFVYRSPSPDSLCPYAHDGQPSCGIGVIMHVDYGVPISELESWGTMTVGFALRSTDYVECSEEGEKIFASFQQAQDCGRPYEECAVEAGVTL